MATVKTYKYKDVEVKVEVDKDGYFHAYALDILSTSNKNKDGNCSNGYPTMDRTIIDIESKVDNFFNTTPKNYEELANAITSTLVWTGYEDCHVDEFIIKTLIENFLKIKKP